jgi:hypothetical protein
MSVTMNVDSKDNEFIWMSAEELSQVDGGLFGALLYAYSLTLGSLDKVADTAAQALLPENKPETGRITNY